MHRQQNWSIGLAILQTTNRDGNPVPHEITGRECVIGRAITCDLVLTDTTVSRRHARVMRKPGGFFVEDLGSQHGTFLNDERIQDPAMLSHGDQLMISGIKVKFLNSPRETLPDAAIADDASSIVSTLDPNHTAIDTGQSNLERKHRALLDITGLLGSTLDLERIFPSMLDAIFDAFTQADSGSIMLNVGGDDDEATADNRRRLKPVAMKRREGAGDVKISRTIAAQVMKDKQAVLSADTSEDARFMSSDSVASLNIRSVMCAPLMGVNDEPIGMIQISTRSLERRFIPSDLELLVNLAGLAARVIEHSQLHEIQLKFARRDYDMQMAKHLQMQFLPRERPPIVEYDLFDFYQAAEGVGGDYFDYIPLPDGRMAITIGDVAGKGVTAALLMSRLCSDARYELTTSTTPSEAANKLNERVLAISTNFRFATFAVCMLDPVKHELTMVVAGHMPPLLRRGSDGSITVCGVSTSGPPLGVTPGYQYQQTTCHLEPGDLVLLYTDGVSEMLDARREQFGEQRVADALHNTEDARSAVESVLQNVKQFSGQDDYNDDLCILAFHRHNIGSTGPHSGNVHDTLPE